MKRSYLLATLFCLTLFATLDSFTRENSSGIVQDVLIQTNQFRRSNGLPGLIIREELNALAREHSADMA
ncbi:MAG: hypothetical protein ABI416_08965, partial [Ginsengibacter sp.]